MEASKKRFSWIGVALLAGFLFALTSFAILPAQRAHAASPAYVRVIHASPYVATADIFLDGTAVLTTFGFGQVSSYLAVPEGPHTVQIAIAGKGVGAAALKQTLSIQPGVVYTVAAIGTTPQSLGLKVFTDDNTAVSGTAKLRIYQLSPDGGSMSVLAGGKDIWDGNYQEASDYFTYAANTTSFVFTSSQNTQQLSISATFQLNTVISIFAIGLFNGSPKAEVVQSQVAAVPGLPQTGSDPFALVNDGHLSTPWLLIIVVLLLIGVTLLTRRWFRVR